MGKMKELQLDITTCDLCYGTGWLYFGNGEDFDTESCDCNPHQLFITKENN
jgi:hypothetical protein